MTKAAATSIPSFVKLVLAPNNPPPHDSKKENQDGHARAFKALLGPLLSRVGPVVPLLRTGWHVTRVVVGVAGILALAISRISTMLL